MEQKKTPGHSGPNATLPIVGVGASAGGLYALKYFLAALPKDFGFVLVFLQRPFPNNLLLNAWKFTSKRDKARIDVDTATKEGKTGYFVRDNGAGFDMTYAKKLFTAFQRIQSTDVLIRDITCSSQL